MSRTSRTSLFFKVVVEHEKGLPASLKKVC
jgi:hypothetical protein